MSRCGPPGQTATERHQSNTGTDQTPPSIGSARLDDEAEAWIDDQWQQMKDAGHPVGKRYLRQKLLADWTRTLAAEAVAAGEIEDPTHVLTCLRRSGSRPVDMATGERATKHLMGAMR